MQLCLNKRRKQEILLHGWKTGISHTGCSGQHHCVTDRSGYKPLVRSGYAAQRFTVCPVLCRHLLSALQVLYGVGQRSLCIVKDTLVDYSSFLIIIIWRDSPQWVTASSSTRFLDHTQHTTQSVGFLWMSDQLVAETSH